MEFYVYCWLALKDMANKCKFEKKQDTKLPELAAELAPHEWNAPDPEWYACLLYTSPSPRDRG